MSAETNVVVEAFNTVSVKSAKRKQIAKKQTLAGYLACFLSLLHIFPLTWIVLNILSFKEPVYQVVRNVLCILILATFYIGLFMKKRKILIPILVQYGLLTFATADMFVLYALILLFPEHLLDKKPMLVVSPNYKIFFDKMECFNDGYLYLLRDTFGLLGLLFVFGSIFVMLLFIYKHYFVTVEESEVKLEQCVIELQDL